MYVFSGFFDEYEVKMFYFTVTFNQVNASLLIKVSMPLKNITDPKLLAVV